MNIHLKSILVLATIALTACGGGGGSTGGNNLAAITGTTTGSVSASSTEVAGQLSVSDADPGQATFVQPTSLTGAYGSWSVTVSGSTAVWRYTLDQTRAPAVTSTETLAIKSQDGSATQNIVVTITVGSSSASSSALVTSVPAPVYTGAYASEKVAVFNRLNDDRARCGFGKLAQNSKLDTAAQNHANYLALNPSEWSHTEIQGHTGFTGSGPGERMAYAGYQYSFGGEDFGGPLWGPWFASAGSDFSVTEPLATNPLLGLYSTVYHLAGLMDRNTEVGLGVSNVIRSVGANEKTLVIESATPFGNNTGQLQASDAITTFPCNGSSGLMPAFKSEMPDPFPSGPNRDVTPYGQPIFVQSARNTTLTLTTGTVTLRGGATVPTTTLTASNDPQTRLLANQVFLVPTVRLADNATYDVALSGTNPALVSASNPTGTWSRTFSFTTGTMLSE